MSAGPLEGYRVIDLGHAIAGPFAATMLADFGAEVIKIEKPGRGDTMRDLGPPGVWWKSMSRNKRNIALDWKHPDSRPVLEKLVRGSHVLVENFRPGVLERNDLGPETLHRWNPDLIILRVSGYGQTGPYSQQPGFGKAAEAISGVCHMTGFPDGPPTHPGFPMGDMMTGQSGAYGVVMALLAQERGRARGQVIDLPIYEPPLRLMDYPVPVRTQTGMMPVRNGNQQPLSFALSGVFQAKDGKWVTYSAATYIIATRMFKLIGLDDMADDPELTSLHDYCLHDARVNAHLKAWMAERDSTEVISQFKEAQTVAALIFDIDDIINDPHFAARENIVSFEDDDCKVIGAVPKLSETPGAVRWLGQSQVGEETRAILAEVGGFDDGEIDALLDAGAVADGKEPVG